MLFSCVKNVHASQQICSLTVWALRIWCLPFVSARLLLVPAVNMLGPTIAKGLLLATRLGKPTKTMTTDSVMVRPAAVSFILRWYTGGKGYQASFTLLLILLSRHIYRSDSVTVDNLMNG